MKHLYKALQVLFVLLSLGLPATVWASGDWKRSDEYRIFEPGEVRENFPIANTRDLIGDDAGTSYVWQKAEPRGGVWIDQIYRSFIEQMGIGDYTTPELSRTAFFYVNRGVDAGDIEAGESYWIPADNNKPESVQQAFAKRLEQRAIARAKAQPVTRGELDNMLSNVTIELDGNKAAEAWVQRLATELLETQGGKILEEDLIGLVATVVANQNLVSQEDLAAQRDTILGALGATRRDTDNRFDGIEAAQAQQGTALKELRATVETIKNAQAKQGDTLSDQSERLGNVEATQTEQGKTLLQQQGAMVGVLARETLNGVVADRELTMRWYDESWVMYVALALVAALSLLGFALLQWSKASKEDLRDANKKAESAAKEAGEANTKAESAVKAAGEANTKAESAVKVAGEAKAQTGQINERLDQVEEDLYFIMELNAQNEFDNESLTAGLVENLQSINDTIPLKVKCRDGRYRHVHVSAAVDEKGVPGMRFAGLKKGRDFVHKLDLFVLRRHLRNAVQKDWVIGIQAARKVSEPA